MTWNIMTLRNASKTPHRLWSLNQIHSNQEFIIPLLSMDTKEHGTKSTFGNKLK